MTHVGNLSKPKLRGWIHTFMFPVAIILGIILIGVSGSQPGVAGSMIFALASVALFGISAMYHRGNWRPGVAARLRRLDHANIFLMIAGTYTPVSLVLLNSTQSTILLCIVWSGAIAGILFRVCWMDAPRWLYVPLYLLLGWSAMIYAGDLFTASPWTMGMILAGGLCYTIGGIIYGLKRPNPVPTAFGFHEIFHALTAVAFICQWTGVLIAITSADKPAL